MQKFEYEWKQNVLKFKENNITHFYLEKQSLNSFEVWKFRTLIDGMTDQ